MWKKIKPYVISIAIALAVGGLAAWLTRDSMEIYSMINQPALDESDGVVFSGGLCNNSWYVLCRCGLANGAIF